MAKAFQVYTGGMQAWRLSRCGKIPILSYIQNCTDYFKCSKFQDDRDEFVTSNSFVCFNGKAEVSFQQFISVNFINVNDYFSTMVPFIHNIFYCFAKQNFKLFAFLQLGKISIRFQREISYADSCWLKFYLVGEMQIVWSFVLQSNRICCG